RLPKMVRDAAARMARCPGRRTLTPPPPGGRTGVHEATISASQSGDLMEHAMADANGKALFYSAALFNWVAALALFCLPPQLGQALALPPGPGTSVWGQVGGFAVVLLGWAYWMVARDHRRYRPYITLGIVGKIAIVLLFTGNAIAGNAAW